ncbi:hypothetical protein [Tsuneonella suprasediminis]|uniref:hypothetical protein n=1 Tax=Tsuneonella suprasediminis TaxID=2306996 RepID=UPI002F92638F
MAVRVPHAAQRRRNVFGRVAAIILARKSDAWRVRPSRQRVAGITGLGIAVVRRGRDLCRIERDRDKVLAFVASRST